MKTEHYTEDDYLAQTTVEYMAIGPFYITYFLLSKKRNTTEELILFVVVFVVLTFPAVAKYSPSGDHAIKCTDTAVLKNTRAKF